MIHKHIVLPVASFWAVGIWIYVKDMMPTTFGHGFASVSAWAVACAKTKTPYTGYSLFFLSWGPLRITPPPLTWQPVEELVSGTLQPSKVTPFPWHPPRL